MNWIITILLIVGAGCSGAVRESAAQAPSHELWDSLLSKHVSAEGWVDYQGFLNDQGKLEEYLSLISKNAPSGKEWSKEEQLAYWINAYNSYTVKLIVDNYPVKSIQDLHPTIYVPGINTVWHKKFFKIGGKETSLDEIEHDILREKFSEPRIHFAINCASYSCPPLRNEAYTADKIEKQLEEQAGIFINDKKRNDIGKDRVEISKIFSWFKRDFTRQGSLIDYLNQYTDDKINKNSEISYMDYNWDLNDISYIKN